MVVIVGIENSDDHALIRQGAELAEAFEDSLHVVHVTEIDVPADDIGSDFADESVAQLESSAAASARKALGDVGVPTEGVGIVDENVARALLDYAAQVDARYIVIGGRKRTAVGKALFGSTTQSILLESTVPVVTVMDE
ncbi:universal stress protein [Halorubrum sp. DTA98]|uniref:universal stress protein n=1 Tax=Halorubrum sp. DTA98 TaxID=3402163 RepID=UPI003AB0D553